MYHLHIHQPVSLFWYILFSGKTTAFSCIFWKNDIVFKYKILGKYIFGRVSTNPWIPWIPWNVLGYRKLYLENPWINFCSWITGIYSYVWIHYKPCIIRIISWDLAFFRWVENKIFLDRMIEVLNDVKKIVQFWENLPKSKLPNSKSYINLNISFDDPLVIVKLHFFSYVAGIVEPFLKQFQIYKSMIPFLFFS